MLFFAHQYALKHCASQGLGCQFLRSQSFNAVGLFPVRGARGHRRWVAEQARELREWLGEFVDRHAGREIGRDAFVELSSLNRLLARDDTYRQIALALTNAGGAGPSRPLQSIQIRRWTTPDRLLQPIAETISDLICNADFRLVRRCDGDGCILRFYDRTKTHARRWCSMAVCGNRAKAAAHRARMARGKSEFP
jgi:predicted RNA-binding Zn ribbon-like protein